MRISTVKPVSWLAVNLILHHLFLDGAAVNTQSLLKCTANQETGFTVEMRTNTHEMDSSGPWFWLVEPCSKLL